MDVSDFQVTRSVRTPEELEAFFLRRHETDGGLANSFELCYAPGFPVMCVFVKDGLASVWYTPSEDRPGFISVSHLDLPSPEGTTIFYWYGEEQPRPNASIVSIAEALQAAKQFLRSGQLPDCIAWLEL